MNVTRPRLIAVHQLQMHLLGVSAAFTEAFMGQRGQGFGASPATWRSFALLPANQSASRVTNPLETTARAYSSFLWGAKRVVARFWLTAAIRYAWLAKILLARGLPCAFARTEHSAAPPPAIAEHVNHLRQQPTNHREARMASPTLTRRRPQATCPHRFAL